MSGRISFSSYLAFLLGFRCWESNCARYVELAVRSQLGRSRRIGARRLADMSAGELLTFAEAQHAQRLQAERNILRAAYQWAVLHSPDKLPPTGKRARERARPAGAEGTPLITEYAAATFGARIQTSPYGAKKLIADAVDIHHRHPELNAGLNAGTVRVGHARHVAEATRELTPDQAAWVDAEVAQICDGRLGWKRFEDVVEGKVAAAAPELARAREEAAARQRGIRRSRVNKHGMATLIVHGPVTTAWVRHLIAHIAGEGR